MDNQIVVSDYAQMDRVLREERAYILNLVKQIKKAGCNVLLIQKSILRCVGNGLLAYAGCVWGNNRSCSGYLGNGSQILSRAWWRVRL